jgi:hypothetical protein
MQWSIVGMFLLCMDGHWFETKIRLSWMLVVCLRAKIVNGFFIKITVVNTSIYFIPEKKQHNFKQIYFTV